MNNIYQLIDELITYGQKNELIFPDDEIYCRNRLLEFFKLNEYEPSDYISDSDHQETRELHIILEDMLDYAAENGLLKDNTITYRDLYDTAIMGLITPMPSMVRSHFNELFNGDSKTGPKEATSYYYEFSKATNYIRTDRIAKDEKWSTSTEFGDLDITINLSKPEKDPRDIAAAGKAKKSGYPACLLCLENEGYAGSFTHPARQNHRVIPITLDGEQYYLQYSPYVYYNEHCIIFNEKHIPMKINRSTMKKLLSFVEMFPHYTAGSNADLPIVGGSILSHDHFQGGGYEFPMVRAPYEKEFVIPGYEDIHTGIIKWPLSTIRLQGDNIDRMVELADHILGKWRSYTDEKAFIFAETKGEPHNTITPIARMRNSGNALNKFNISKDVYELDLVLRNNITTDEHPLGVFHPHAEYHHIKKENIGLIEVMGLAILPARLKKEMSSLVDIILNGESLEAAGDHAEWAASILQKYPQITKYPQFTEPLTSTESNKTERARQITNILHNEIGYIFAGVLEDAGVFKKDTNGVEAFQRFIDTL